MNVYKRNGHTVMYNTIDDFGALLNTSIAMNKPNVIDFDLLKQKYSKTNGQILYEHSEVVGFTIKDNDPVVL